MPLHLQVRSRLSAEALGSATEENLDVFSQNMFKRIPRETPGEKKKMKKEKKLFGQISLKSSTNHVFLLEHPYKPPNDINYV